MMNILILMVASYAMSSILVDQKIFDEAREWITKCSSEHPNFFTKKLCQFMSCYFCTGFWCGLFLTAFVINPFNITILDPFLGGLIGSASSYYLHIVLGILEKYAEQLGIDI